VTGNTHGQPEFPPPAPTRMVWDFSNAELVQTISEAHGDAQKVLSVRFLMKLELERFNDISFAFRIWISAFWFMTHTAKDL